MKSLLEVAKEATNKIRQKLNSKPYPDDIENICNQIVKSVYVKQSFFFRLKYSFEEYHGMVYLDLQYNFKGGTTI